MKEKYFLIAAISLALSIPVFAADQDDCAIWLCLPTGFPSGCSGAKSAFKKRIKHLRPPLPDLMSCVVDAPDGTMPNMDYQMGVVSYIPASQKCVKYEITGYGNTGPQYSCTQYEEIPAHYVDGPCIPSSYSGTGQNGCTATHNYITVYQDGGVIGETYYWN